ncbi:hypothetical protein PG987_006422 [Apiospora arundinis]
MLRPQFSTPAGSASNLAVYLEVDPNGYDHDPRLYGKLYPCAAARVSVTRAVFWSSALLSSKANEAEATSVREQGPVSRVTTRQKRLQ